MRPAPRFFEDFAVGLRFRSFEEIALTAERIKTFAAEFDPQPFHLDDAAGPETFFGGLVASGWHTAAVAMRLLVDSDLGLGGQGAGVAVESMRWRGRCARATRCASKGRSRRPGRRGRTPIAGS